MKNKLLILLILLSVVLAFTMVGCTTGDSVITEISVTEMPQTIYVKGQSFNLGNAQIKVLYDDGTEKTVLVTEYMLSSFDPNLVGEQYLSISYEGKSTRITVVVLEENIVNIDMKSLPTRVEYIEEQKLDISGATIQINYENGNPSIIPLTEDMLSGFETKKIGEQNITVTYKGFHTSFKVSVKAKTLLGIEIKTSPTKNIYFLRETLDVTGGSIKLMYDNNYPVILKLSDIPSNEIKYDYDFSAANSRAVIKITYLGKETSFTAQVKEKDADSFEIITQPSIRQLINKDLDFSGMVLRVNYNNGEYEDFTFPNSDAKYAFAYGYDNITAGTKKVIFTIPSIIKTFEYSVEVYNRTAIELLIIQPKDITIYQDNFVNLEGWKYQIRYDNGEVSQEAAVAESMLVDPNEDALFCPNEGDKTLKFKLDALTTDYTFSVTSKEIVGITVKGGDNCIKRLGEDLTTEGIKLEILYNDGSKNKLDVPLTPSMILNYDKNALKVQDVIINYSDKFTSDFQVGFVITTINVASSVEQNSALANTTFALYDILNLSGLSVKINFADGSAPIVVSEIGREFVISCNAFEGGTTKFVRTGTFDLIVEYLGIPANVNSKVIIPITITNTLKTIELTDKNNNIISSFGDIVQGVSIDLSNFKLKKTYQSTVEYVSLELYMLDYKREDLTIGSRNVIISYSESGLSLTHQSTIKVIIKTATGISISNLPSKIVYPMETEISLDLNGLQILIHFNNKTEKTVIYNEDTKGAFSTTIAVGLNANTFVVTLTYEHSGNRFSTEFEVTKSNIALISISYENGEQYPTAEIMQSNGTTVEKIFALKLKGEQTTIGSLNIILNYADGSSATATSLNALYAAKPNAFIISNPYFTQSSSEMIKIIDIYFEGVVFKIAFIVKATELSHITYEAKKITVKEGKDIDLSSQEYFLTLNFTNNTTIKAPMQHSNVVKSDSNPNGYDKANTTSGDRNITLIYIYNERKFSVNITIEVVAKAMVSININELPKISYTEGDRFTVNNDSNVVGTISVNYDNGTTIYKSLGSASINNTTSSFNINTINFNSSEFSGNSKNQTIYIKYTESGITKDCSYDVYVRDRKTPIINYHQTNIYTFVYGTVEALNFDALGYATFSETVPSAKLKVRVTYKDKNDLNSQEVEQLPTAVGKYVVIIRYVSNMSDRFNNDFTDASKEINITPKDIYVKVKDKESIYGEKHNTEYIFFAARNRDHTYEMAQMEENNPFAYSDNFDSSNFRDLNKILRVLSIAITPTTAAGSYVLRAENCISKNYKIIYADSQYKINRRDLVVVPQTMEYIYGQFNFNLPYSIFQKYVDGGYIAESGLVNGDRLGGALGYGTNSPVTAGTYQINIGTLNNSNYNVLFNEFVRDTVEDSFVTINRKKIYIKANNISIVYGQEIKSLAVKYYSDALCIITDGAFAFSDDKDVFGDRKILNNIPNIMNVGKHNIQISFDSEYIGNYEVIFVNSTVAVMQRDVEITIDAFSQFYGEKTPSIPYRVTNSGDSSGLIGDEKLLGQINIYNLNANIGKYSYDITELKANNKNYNIIYHSNNYFTIKAIDVKVMIADSSVLTKKYDGKLPTLDNKKLSFHNNSLDVAIEDDNIIADLLKAIEIGFINRDKDVSSYPLTMNNGNSNFTLAFDKAYNYEITPIEVKIIYQVKNAVGEFVAITENSNSAVFKNSAYEFRAIVDPSSIMDSYYDDGTIIVGQKDIVNAFINRANITNASAVAYVLSATSLDNNNYKLPAVVQNSSFTINPYLIKVRFKTVATPVVDGDTILYYVIEKEYQSQGAKIGALDFTIINDPDDVPWNTAPNLLFKVRHIDSTITTEPIDVIVLDAATKLYESHYIDFNSVSFNNPNYAVEMDKAGAEYAPRFRILPKKTTLNIYSQKLGKIYDGQAPSIRSEDYYGSPAIPTEITLNFTFNGKIGTAAAVDAGKYAIGVICSSNNYDIILSQPYQFTINPLSTTLSVNSSGTIKTYDGKLPIIERRSIVLGNEYSGFRMINVYTEQDFNAAQAVEGKERANIIIYFKEKLITKDVGIYKFEIFDNDKNVTYNLPNGQKDYEYKINAKSVEILINEGVDISKTYGDAEIDFANKWKYKNNIGTVDGETLQFTLSRRLNNSDPNSSVNFNVGRYLISLNLTAGSDVNKNYNVSYSVERQVLYIINPSKIYVKISDDIGKNSGDNTFIYGSPKTRAHYVNMGNLSYFVKDSEPNNILKSYLPGETTDEFGNAVHININTINFPDERELLKATLDTGTYAVSFSGGMESTNYEVEIISGTVTIAKKELRLTQMSEQNDKLVSYRTYGDDSISLHFEGLISGETLIKSNGKNEWSINGNTNYIFKMPTILEPDNNQKALNPYTEADVSVIHSIYFRETQYGSTFTSKNYYIAFDGEGDNQPYGVQVNKAELIYAISKNASDSANQPTQITKVYGTKIALGKEYFYVFNGFKNSESVTSLGVTLPTLSFALSVGTFNIAVANEDWDGQIDTKFKNYSVASNTNQVVVTKKKMTITVDNVVEFMYNNEISNPYPFLYAGAVSNKVNTYNYKLKYVGLTSASGEGTPDDITTVLKEVQGADAGTMLPFPAHSISIRDFESNRKMYGEQGVTIALQDAAIISNSNYTIESDINAKCIINIGITDIKFSESFKHIGSTFNVEDLPLAITLDNGETIVAKMTELPAYIKGAGASNGVTIDMSNQTISQNQNYLIKFGYAADFALPLWTVDNSGNAMSTPQTVSKQLSDINGQLRIYSKDDINNNVQFLVDGQPMSNTKNIGGANTHSYTYNTDIAYDKINLSMILNPLAINSSYFEMILNGTTEDKWLKLRIGRNTTAKANNLQLMFGTAIIDVNIGNVDLFDGYLHDVTIYLEKQFNRVMFVIDGNKSISTFLTDGKNTYEISDLGKAQFTVKDLNCYMKEIEYFQRGIYDNSDTFATPKNATTDNVIVNNSILYVDQDNFEEKAFTFGDIFTLLPQNSPYAQKFYQNGKEVSQFRISSTGIYELSMEIIDGLSNVFSTAKVLLTVTTMRRATIDGNPLSSANPHRLYGYEIDTTKDSDLWANGGATNVSATIAWGNNSVPKASKVNVVTQIEKGRNGLSSMLACNTQFILKGDGTNSIGLAVSSAWGSREDVHETAINIKLGSTVKSIALGNTINWATNAYEIELLTDDGLSITKGIGDLSITLNIYSGNVLILTRRIDAESNDLTLTELKTLCALPANVRIEASGTKVSVSKVTYNEANTSYNNYLVNDSTFTLYNKAGLGLSNNDTIVLANNHEKRAYNPNKNITLGFDRALSSQATSNISLELFKQGTKSAIVTVDIKKKTIGFVFKMGDFSSTAQYFDLTAANSGFKTIKIVMNDATTSLIDGAFGRGRRTAVGLKLYIDGVFAKEYFMPYYNSYAGWYGDNAISGDEVVMLNSFMPYYISPKLTVGQALTLKEFDVRAGGRI